MEEPIEAVAEQADFSPAYRGEDYVTLTFRVPKDTAATPGIWSIVPLRAGQLDWAIERHYPGEDDV